MNQTNEQRVVEYNLELKRRIGIVFDKHPEIPDHRNQHPWITGFLGDPFSGIWFIGENPSLGTAERITQTVPTEESQWAVSKGDILFRTMLVKYGFKNPPLESCGGWNCYITDLIKQTEYVGEWRSKSTTAINRFADIWAEVLAWELETSKPRLIVGMGRQVGRLLTHLGMTRGMKFPVIRYIEHYSYVGMRPCGKMKAMHPERVAKYDKQFEEVAKEFANL